MSFNDRTEADDGITVGQDDENKILNSVERLTLVDQSQCMGNQAVTIWLWESERLWIRQNFLKYRWYSSAEQLWKEWVTSKLHNSEGKNEAV